MHVVQLGTVTQQLAAACTNAPVRLASAEVLGAVGRANQDAAAAVFDQHGKCLLAACVLISSLSLPILLQPACALVLQYALECS